MNHEYINSNQVIERYVMDKLSEEERDAFERHYLSCESCINDIDAAEVLHKQLPGALESTSAAGFESSAAKRPVRASILRSPIYSMAATILLGVAVATIFNISQLRDEEASARAALDARLAELLAPQPNTPVVRVGTMRGGGAAWLNPGSDDDSPRPLPGEATTRAQVRLPATPGPIVLVLELADPGYQTYSATLMQPTGEPVWTSQALMPDVTDSLILTLHSATLGTGVYLIAVKGVDDSGELQGHSSYAVRFLPAE